MTTRVRILAAVAAISLGGPAIAQMGGGGMPAGAQSGEGSSPIGYDPNRMSAGEQKSWTACQAMPGEVMAKDKKCLRLQRKADRIANKAG